MLKRIPLSILDDQDRKHLINEFDALHEELGYVETRIETIRNVLEMYIDRLKLKANK